MYPHKRPVFLQLRHIHLPITGWVSITHRISGALLFLSVPLWLWLWQQSLTGPDEYAQVQAWLGQGFLRVLLALHLWWFVHHLLAGLRLLLLDADIGVSLPKARRSAGLLMVVSPLILLFLLVVL